MHARKKLNLANQIHILKQKLAKYITENTTISINKNVAEPQRLELHDYVAFLENPKGVLEKAGRAVFSKTFVF